MIFGADLSKYQPVEQVDGHGFVILNVDDPGFADKASRAAAQGIPWGFYVWVHGGENFGAHADRAIARARGVGLGEPPLGAWWDYEDAGVTPDQLTAGFFVADQRGMKAGYYSNPGTLDHTPFLDRPYWLAEYPGLNDGAFPGLDQYRAPRPVNLWQYSSTSGTLDVNVVVDEPWWAAWAGIRPSPMIGDDVIFRANGNSTSNVEVTDQSTWAVCGTALVRATPGPNDTVVEVDAEFLGAESVRLRKIGDAALATLGELPASTATDLGPLRVALGNLADTAAKVKGAAEEALAAVPG